MGKKKQPHYRIVVADGRSPRDGRFVENIGYYQPVSTPARLSVDLDRVEYWVGRGAEVSKTVGSLVRKARKGGDDRVAMVEAAPPIQDPADKPPEDPGTESDTQDDEAAATVSA